LEYAEYGYIADFSVLGQKVALAPDHEIHFHKNKLPHFFTMAEGQTLKVVTNSGELQITNPPDQLASVSLAEDQKLEVGYVSQTLKIGAVQAGPGRLAMDPETNTIEQIEFAPQTVQVAGQSCAIHNRAEFYANGGFKLVILASNQTLRIGSQPYLLQGALLFDENQNVRLAQIAEDTVFALDGKTIPLYKGDMLVFSEAGQVVGIKPGPGDPAFAHGVPQDVSETHL
jgi:hypothetical protein